MRDDPGGREVAALVIDDAMRACVVAHVRAALPNEGVGLLGVAWRDAAGGRIAEARHFYPGTNFRASPVRFEMDRLELIAALRDIEDRGLALGAIVHSHPAGPPTPSRTDLAEAWYPEALMVIASFAAPEPVLQAWQVVPEGDQWRPLQVPIVATVAAALSPGIAGDAGFRE
jgi:proteasome lid subunit RPN8/RPN11